MVGVCGQSKEMTNRWFGCEGQAGRAGDGMGDNSSEFCLERRLNISHGSICTHGNVVVGKGQQSSLRIITIKIKIIIRIKSFQTGFREVKSALPGVRTQPWAGLSEFKQKYSELRQNQIANSHRCLESRFSRVLNELELAGSLLVSECCVHCVVSEFSSD